MSELINKNDNRATIRWKLLTGASALALAAYASSVELARAEDSAHPLIWLELDGQFAQQKNGEELFVPPFMFASPFDGAAHAYLEKAPPTIWDKGGKLTFQPNGSDWIVSAAIQYGRISRKEDHSKLISHVPYKYFYNAYQHPASYGAESHTILDFQVGKDVGLGRFGSDGRSAFSAGVRFAQFHSKTTVDIKSQPTNHVLYTGYYRFYADFAATRNFSGIGPSLSWDASADIAGNPSGGRITLDWGVNAALLFGRQRTRTQHQTKENHIAIFYSHPNPPYTGFASRIPVYQSSASSTRSKNVTVPNFGAFAGMSLRYANAKISLGYRADYFFGVLDGGIDTAKKEDRAFYGPFVSIAIGIGD
jgi:iron complex outermembrane recepter protein